MVAPISVARLLLIGLFGAALAVALVACDEPPVGKSLLRQSISSADTPRDRTPATGPLTVLPENPRYFSRPQDRSPVYLTGSHTWNNFQDWGLTDPPEQFNYAAYLDFLERHGHNFIRLYVWEQAAWFPGTEEKVVIAPVPYLRPGPGRALDGGLRFDLTQFDPGYFRRMRERVKAAGAHGIYVSVMLFNGWSIELKGEKVGNPWRGHPYNRNNNINGIDGDTNGDGEGKEVHTLTNPTVLALQKAYLRKVVETMGDLDNVLWEISNESHAESRGWQYEMIRFIREVESGGARHPVGMTSMYPEPLDKNALLLAGPADWISPHDNFIDRYKDDPPASTGHKVVITDTDHIWGVGGDPRWVWASFMRGMNPIFMDPYVTAIRKNLPAWPSVDVEHGTAALSPAPEWEAVRAAMGYTRALAARVGLASMKPMGELASTHYCLAEPGREYLAFLPLQGGELRQLMASIMTGFAGERVDLDLSAAPGTFDVEWVDVKRGVLVAGDPVTGGRHFEFRAPFPGAAVLHIKVREGAGTSREQRPRAYRG